MGENKYYEYTEEIKDKENYDIRSRMDMKKTDKKQHEENVKNAEETREKLISNSAVKYEQSLDKIEQFLSEEYSNPKSAEYLVDGAILTCSNCTKKDIAMPKEVRGMAVTEYYRYFAKEDSSINAENIPAEYSDKVLGRLIVTENPKSEVTGLCQATIADSKKGDNIPYFGNCLRLPDSETEMLKFNKMNNKSAEAVALRKEGTCKYLMKLEEEWENYELAKEFFSFTDFETGEKPGITMTSMLFCKHGGFIYPITSGQVVTDNVIAEEVDEKQSLAEPDPSNPQAVKEYMWNFFRDAGFSEYAVAGILGNVYAETEFDPRKVNSSGYYGLFQCGGGREKELFERGKEYAEKMNLPEDEGWKKAHIQCEYALDEYYKRTKENSGWVNNRLKLEDGSMIVGTKENFENAQSASEAALIWALSFERCIVAETKQKAEDGQVFYTEIQHKDKRLDKADEIYEEFAGTN